MKNFKLWSLTMLAVLALPLMVACGDDDDNSTSNYTEAEIVDLLTGTWEIQGNYRAAVNENTYNEFDYTARIEFKENKTFRVRNYKPNYKIQSTAVSLSSMRGYEIVKKNGKTYICFELCEAFDNGASYRKADFLIVSLKKNSFKLIYENSDDNMYEYFSIISTQ